MVARSINPTYVPNVGATINKGIGDHSAQFCGYNSEKVTRK